MSEPVFDKAYWAGRLAAANSLHHSVFLCGSMRWSAIEKKHREILARHVKPGESVLDAGCGYGRLSQMLPEDVRYLGVDLSDEMVATARRMYPDEKFRVVDLRQPWRDMGSFDWAVMVSVRPMVIRNCGQLAWGEIEENLRSVARKLLYLEYDEEGEGSVE